jgi:hypothetical protein
VHGAVSELSGSSQIADGTAELLAAVMINAENARD